MVDLDTLVKIIQNFNAKRKETRLANLDSFFFKLVNNRIGPLDLGFVGNKLPDAIYQFLEELSNDVKELELIDSVESKTFDLMMKVLQTLFSNTGEKKISNNKEYGKVLDRLYYLSRIQQLPSTTLSTLNETIAAIVRQTVTIKAEENWSETPASQPAKTMEVNEIKARLQSSSGAGAIFTTPLAHHGYKFPSVVIVESDEKYLFDAEVYLKLRKDNLRNMLDIVTNFPAPALLQRPTLLQALFDVLSVPFSHMDYVADPYGYHPVAALEIIYELLVKCEKTYQLYLENGLLSETPTSDILKEDNNNQQSSTLTTAGNATVYNVHLMRYPMHYENKHLINTTGDILPIPSLSGFAFACAAAALALSQSKDLRLQKFIERILSLSFKILFGFITITNHTSVDEDNDVTASKDFQVNLARLKHLLNRFDCLLTDKVIQPIRENLINFNNFFSLLSEEIPTTSRNDPNTLLFDEKIYEYQHSCLALSIFKSFLSFISFIPLNFFTSPNSTITEGGNNNDGNDVKTGKVLQKLQLSNDLQEFMKKVFLSYSSWNLIFSLNVMEILFNKRNYLLNSSILAEIEENTKISFACYLFSIKKLNTNHINDHKENEYIYNLQNKMNYLQISHELLLASEQCIRFYEKNHAKYLKGINSSQKENMNEKNNPKKNRLLEIEKKNHLNVDHSEQEFEDSVIEFNCRFPETLPILLNYLLLTNQISEEEEQQQQGASKSSSIFRLIYRFLLTTRGNNKKRFISTLLWLISLENSHLEENFELSEQLCIPERRLLSEILHIRKSFALSDEYDEDEFPFLSEFLFTPEMMLIICWNYLTASFQDGKNKQKENRNNHRDDNQEADDEEKNDGNQFSSSPVNHTEFSDLLIQFFHAIVSPLTKSLSTSRKFNFTNKWMGNPREWLALLPWLEFLSWKYEESNHFQEIYLSSIHLLINKLEEFSLIQSNQSNHHQERNEFARISLISLFHKNSSIRLKGMMNLNKYFLHDYEFSNKFTEISEEFSNLDLFAHSFLQLQNEWDLSIYQLPTIIQDPAAIAKENLAADLINELENGKEKISIPFSRMNERLGPKGSGNRQRTPLHNHNKKKDSNSLFTHSDVEKLTSIIFNNDFPESTKLSALKQLFEMFQNDSILLSSSSSNWIIQFSNQLIELFSFYLLKPIQITPNSTIIYTKKEFQSFDRISIHGQEFCLTILSLLQLFLINFPNLFMKSFQLMTNNNNHHHQQQTGGGRGNNQAAAGEEEEVITGSIFLALFIYNKKLLPPLPQQDYILNKKLPPVLNPDRQTSPSMALVLRESLIFYKKLIFLSTKFLLSYCQLNYFWDLTKQSTELSSIFHVWYENQSNVFIPMSFFCEMIQDINFVDMNETVSVETLQLFHKKNKNLLLNPTQNAIEGSSNGVVVHQSLEFYSQQMIPLPPLQEIEIAFLDISHPSEESVKIAAATSIFDLLINVQSHDHLSQSLLISEILSSILETHLLEIHFIQLKISILSAVSNIVTTMPRTKKDKFTLIHIMQYFTFYFSHLPKETNQENILEMVYNVIECLSTILIPYFQANTIQSIELQATNGSNNTASFLVKEERILSYGLMKSFLELLTQATSFKNGFHLQFDILFLSNKIIHWITKDILFFNQSTTIGGPQQQSLSSAAVAMTSFPPCYYFRSKALSIVHSLITNHHGIMLLQSLEEENYSIHQLPTSSSSRQQQKLFTSNRILQISLKPLYSIINLIKLIRSNQNDSLIESNYLLESMKLLLIYLQQESFYFYNSHHHGISSTGRQHNNSIYMEYLIEETMWTWLIRFLYDRRNEVRYLTIEIIHILIPIFVTFWKEKQFNEQKKATAAAAEAEEVDAIPKESTNEEEPMKSFHSFQFPPIEQLYYLFNDEKESSLIRIKSLEMILCFYSSLETHFYHQNYSNTTTTTNTMPSSMMMKMQLKTFQLSYGRILEQLKKLLLSCLEENSVYYPDKQQGNSMGFKDDHHEDSNQLHPSLQYFTTDGIPLIIPKRNLSIQSLTMIIQCLSILLNSSLINQTTTNYDSSSDEFFQLLNHSKIIPLLIPFMSFELQNYLFFMKPIQIFLHNPMKWNNWKSFFHLSLMKTSSLHYDFYLQLTERKKLFNHTMIQFLLSFQFHYQSPASIQQRSKQSSSSSSSIAWNRNEQKKYPLFYMDCIKHSNILQLLMSSLNGLFIVDNDDNGNDEDKGKILYSGMNPDDDRRIDKNAIYFLSHFLQHNFHDFTYFTSILSLLLTLFQPNSSGNQVGGTTKQFQSLQSNSLEHFFFFQEKPTTLLTFFDTMNRCLSTLNYSFDYFYSPQDILSSLSSETSSGQDYRKIQERQVLSACLERIIQFFIIFMDSPMFKKYLSTTSGTNKPFTMEEMRQRDQLITSFNQIFIEFLLLRIQFLNAFNAATILRQQQKKKMSTMMKGIDDHDGQQQQGEEETLFHHETSFFTAADSSSSFSSSSSSWNEELFYEEYSFLSNHLDFLIAHFLENFELSRKILKNILFAEKYSEIQITEKKVKNYLWQFYYSQLIQAVHYTQYPSAPPAASAPAAAHTPSSANKKRTESPAAHLNRSTPTTTPKKSRESPPSSIERASSSSGGGGSLKKTIDSKATTLPFNQNHKNVPTPTKSPSSTAGYYSSPIADRIPNTSSASFKTPVTGKWREKTRGYIWKEQQQQQQQQQKDEYLGDLPNSLKKSLFLTLLIFKNILFDAMSFLSDHEIRVICSSFSHLLKYVVRHSISLPNNSNSTGPSFDQTTHLGDLQKLMSNYYQQQEGGGGGGDGFDSFLSGNYYQKRSLRHMMMKIPSNGQIANLFFINMVTLMKNSILYTLAHLQQQQQQSMAAGNGEEEESINTNSTKKPVNPSLIRIKEYFFQSFHQKTVAIFTNQMRNDTKDYSNNHTKDSSNNNYNSNGTGGLLHFLISIGVGTSFQLSIRHLALQFCAFLLQTNYFYASSSSSSSSSLPSSHVIIPPAVRISLSHILAIQIQAMLTGGIQSPAHQLPSIHKDKLIYFHLLALLSFVYHPSSSILSSNNSTGEGNGVNGLAIMSTMMNQLPSISCYHTQLCEKHFNIQNYNNLYDLQSHASKLNNNNLTKKTLQHFPTNTPTTSHSTSSSLLHATIKPTPSSSHQHHHQQQQQQQQQQLIHAIDHIKLIPLNDLFHWIFEKYYQKNSSNLMNNTEAGQSILLLINKFLFHFYYSSFYQVPITTTTTAIGPSPIVSTMKAMVSQQQQQALALDPMNTSSNNTNNVNNHRLILNMLSSENILQMMLALSHCQQNKPSRELFRLPSSSLPSSSLSMGSDEQLELIYRTTLKVIFHANEKMKSLIKQLAGRENLSIDFLLTNPN